MSERLFQYAVLLNPTPEERKAGKKTVVVLPPSEFFLAVSESEVAMKAAKEIPASMMDRADRLEVAVRPF